MCVILYWRNYINMDCVQSTMVWYLQFLVYFGLKVSIMCAHDRDNLKLRDKYERRISYYCKIAKYIVTKRQW